MRGHALTTVVAACAIVSASCSRGPAELPPADSAKRQIPNIGSMSLDELKRYYDECVAFHDIGHPLVPYLIEDCRAVRARWDRRDMDRTSTTQSAPSLPKLK